MLCTQEKHELQKKRESGGENEMNREQELEQEVNDSCDRTKAWLEQLCMKEKLSGRREELEDEVI